MTAVTQAPRRETGANSLEGIVADGVRLGKDPAFRSPGDGSATRLMPVIATTAAFLRQVSDQDGGAL